MREGKTKRKAFYPFLSLTARADIIQKTKTK
jgi:hypothetical protein